MRECQRWVYSDEFSEWLGVWAIEDEPPGDEAAPPAAKWEQIKAWATAHNARLAGKVNG